jgi:hypothetical protein
VLLEAMEERLNKRWALMEECLNERLILMEERLKERSTLMEEWLNKSSALMEERIRAHIDKKSKAMEEWLTEQSDTRTALVDERIMAHMDERFEEVNKTMAGIQAAQDMLTESANQLTTTVNNITGLLNTAGLLFRGASDPNPLPELTFFQALLTHFTLFAVFPTRLFPSLSPFRPHVLQLSFQARPHRFQTHFSLH